MLNQEMSSKDETLPDLSELIKIVKVKREPVVKQELVVKIEPVVKTELVIKTEVKEEPLFIDKDDSAYSLDNKALDKELESVARGFSAINNVAKEDTTLNRIAIDEDVFDFSDINIETEKDLESYFEREES